eukprot:GHRQ01033288.1.p1 GENE.GHRQ01033288.1~~GHRQ01033288.1.p1  ORF type:complete len:178 (-),score=29.32 GHRQ01033288.1:260-793(-)
MKDSDCAGTSKCSMDSSSQSCSCSSTDGQDRCELLGTCVEYCKTKAVVQQLADANRQVVVCDPFLPNSCTSGLVCQPSSTCLELTCQPGAGIKPVQCRGLCLPAVRLLMSARFSHAGNAVAVSLNTPAKSGSYPCSSVFEMGTTTTLGGGATCDVSEQTVSGGPPRGCRFWIMCCCW